MSSAVLQINLNHARRAQDILIQRMRENSVEIAVIAEPWWVPSGDERWFSSLGGTSLSAVLVGENGRPCSLVCRGLFYVAVKWGDSLVVSVYFPPSENINMFSRLLDELEEHLETFPTLPALVAGDFNARFSRWDPKGRSNCRGELLYAWANRVNLGLLSRVGCPTCVRPQGSSVVDLTWGTPAAGVRLSDWRVDQVESLSDHLYISYSYRHGAAGDRISRPQGRKLPRWKTNSMKEDYLDAALISGEWTGGNLCGECAAGIDCVDKLVKWAQSTLKQACDMAMSRVRGQIRGSKSTYWWSDELTKLRAVATATVRKLSRARKKKKNSEEIVRCLDARNDARRALARAIKEAKKNSWRDLLDSIEEDPWGRP
ncbi:uncharacterized protein LOC124956620 [Vespa velutina]|uniref:uncharacterized protein LOC124956620 n=1 Tax=Vespa velutina TaxID=202808 RepID=UPI001FB28FCF|nr:uncharacterized protein LOC124956620 [Vespa velutina]